MKNIIFAVILMASLAAQAQTSVQKIKVLDCMEPVFLDDPLFQQGSEKFFDVLIVDGKFEVKFTSGELKSETILQAEQNSAGYISFDEGSFYSTWKTAGDVSMVLRDFGNRWRGTLMFPRGYQSETLQMAPGAEVDLACVLKYGAPAAQ